MRNVINCLFRSLKTVFFIVFISSCASHARIYGSVVRVSGNQMPSPDIRIDEPVGFKTTVYFFEPFRSVKKEGSPFVFFNSIQAKEVAKVVTDDYGRFRVKLLAGTYSVVIQKDTSSFYSNITDGEGFVNKWTFVKGRKYELPLKADWDAVY